MKKVRRMALAWAVLGLLGTGLMAQKAHKEVTEGNLHFKAGRFEKALEQYTLGVEKAPDSPLVRFNLGDSQYKLEQFDNAEESFSRALSAQDPKLRGQAHYNYGNALYRQQRLQESVEAFKEALRLDPRDTQAKHNLEFALKQQQEQQQQQQSDSEDGESEDEENSEQEQDQKRDQEQEESDDRNQQDSDQQQSRQDDREESSQDQSGREEDPQEPDSRQDPQEQDAREEQPGDRGQLSREEARQLLAAIQEDLKAFKKEQLRKARRRSNPSEKDW